MLAAHNLPTESLIDQLSQIIAEALLLNLSLDVDFGIRCKTSSALNQLNLHPAFCKACMFFQLDSIECCRDLCRMGNFSFYSHTASVWRHAYVDYLANWYKHVQYCVHVLSTFYVSPWNTFCSVLNKIALLGLNTINTQQNAFSYWIIIRWLSFLYDVILLYSIICLS